MTELTTVEIQRDRWGRPLVYPPTGGDKPTAYTRCTTFVGGIEDTYKLGQWQQRHAVRGVALHDDLIAAVRAHDPADKSGLDALVDEAKERSGAGDAARYGTYLHAVTEAADRGEDPGAVPLPWMSTGAMDPLAYVPDLAAYTEATRDLKAVHIEAFTVQDMLKVGGTPDRVVSYKGKRYIADLKTGQIKLGALKIAAQLAMYARSSLYNPMTYERTLHGAELDKGIVIHLPAGSGTCQLYWFDLIEGWEAVKLSRTIREKRSLPFSKLVTGVGIEPQTPTPADPLPQTSPATTLAEHIQQAPTRAEVERLWRDFAAEWTDRHTELAKARIAALADSPTHNNK